jgi:hypothetical protein
MTLDVHGIVPPIDSLFLNNEFYFRRRNHKSELSSVSNVKRSTERVPRRYNYYRFPSVDIVIFRSLLHYFIVGIVHIRIIPLNRHIHTDSPINRSNTFCFPHEQHDIRLYYKINKISLRVIVHHSAPENDWKKLNTTIIINYEY